jgi:RNA polymerase sigma-B factor
MQSAPIGSALREVQERRLVDLYQRDPDARNEVVAAFEPLVASLTRRYFRGGELFEDLQQVAFGGLLKALERYDTKRPTPFVAFAVPTISGELRRHYRDHGWAVHVNRRAQEAAQRVMAAERSATQPLSTRDIAEQLEMTIEEVVDARMAAQSMFAHSLEGTDGDGDGRPLADRIGGETDPGYADTENRYALDHLLGELSERDRLIIDLRFNEELSQAEIGRRIGVSQMHVSRLLFRILDELHHVSRRTG